MREIVFKSALAMAAMTLAACIETDAKLTAASIPDTYNAELAEELGADDYGMRSYVMVVLKTGPKDTEITDEAKRGEIFKGHFANMRTQAEAGKLALAGPFDDPGGDKRGLYIFNVATIDEAQAVVMTDPAVEAGIFTPEFTKYYGSAALMKVNDIHTTIAKTNPG